VTAGSAVATVVVVVVVVAAVVVVVSTSSRYMMVIVKSCIKHMYSIIPLKLIKITHNKCHQREYI
jgi:hypothetical protein